ncbi:MAG: hypothetical protein AAF968_07030 [Pseudomonadota bacterium]
MTMTTKATTRKAKTCAAMDRAERKRATERLKAAEESFHRVMRRLDAATMKLEMAVEEAGGPESCPKPLLQHLQDADRALRTVLDLQEKIDARLEAARAANGAAVIDIEEARREIAARLDRLAA